MPVGTGGLFLNSPEDDEVLQFQGSRSIPGTSGKDPDEFVVDAAGNGDFLTIAEALTELGVSSGTIRVLAGTYTITTALTLAANQSIIGSGYGTNITTTSNITCITSTANRVMVENCRIDGNNTGAAQNGIDFSGTECTIRNCWVTQMGGVGIIIGGARTMIIGCIVEDCTGDCLSIGGDNGSIVGCEIDNSGDTGIEMISGDQWTIVGNRITNHGLHGIRMTSCSFNQITGNYIFSNGDTTVGDGINLSVSQENVIVGNHISQNNDMGVRITTTATSYRTLIVGNVVLNNNDGQISDGGSLSLVANNIVA